MNRDSIMRIFATVPLILGIASFAIRNGQFLSESKFYPKIFELALAVSLFATLLYMLLHRKDAQAFFVARKREILLIVLLLAGMIVGSAWSYLTLKVIPDQNILVEYGRFLAAFTGFLLVLFWVSRTPQLFSWFIAAFFVPIGYIPFLFLPKAADALGMIESSGRLRGFHNDPNYFATLLLVAFCFLFAYIVFGKRQWSRVLAILAAIGVAGLLWWAGSRGNWLAMVIAPIGMLAVQKPRRFRIITLFAALLLLIILAGFLLLPFQAKLVAAVRVFPQPQYRAPLESHGFSGLFRALQDNPAIRISAEQHRSEIWGQYLIKTVQNPLGFGPGYRFHSPVLLANVPFASHNILLETLLVTGWVGFIAVMLLGRRIKNALRTALDKTNTWQTLGITCALIALLISTLFLESLALRWLWVLAALAISVPWNKAQQT